MSTSFLKKYEHNEEKMETIKIDQIKLLELEKNSIWTEKFTRGVQQEVRASILLLLFSR